MSTLYRSYRPQNFSEILGQNHIKITLQNEISAGRIAQAFLFCGPRAVGKTTLARVLAKAVNCLNRVDGQYEPCNNCASCNGIALGKNLDVVEIDAASNTGVDNVRENIIAFSRLAPANSKFKVFIIDEVHMLSLSAFNALLKIIEEPPAHIIFILCTTEIHKVPLTIISRCERFDFKRISVSDIVKKLTAIAAAEKIEIDREVLEAIARRSGGHLRDAESLLGQIFSLGDKKITLEQAELVMPHYNSNEAVDLLDCLSRKDAAKAINLVNSLVDRGVNLKNFNTEIISLLRHLILNKLSAGLTANLGLDLGENLERRLNQIADNLSWGQLFLFTRRFLEAYNDNKNSLILQLPLELAIAELCFGSTKMNSLVDPIISDRNSPRSLEAEKERNVIKSGISAEADVKKDSIVKKTENFKPNFRLDLSPEEIKEKWPEFLVKIKKYNHSLSFVLQNCQPQAIVNNELSLIFKYKFHQDRINDAAIKKIIEDTLREVFGCHLTLTSIIDENLEMRREEKAPSLAVSEEKGAVSQLPDEPKAGGLINDLLKTFGGEIIN
ncbi:MAG: DNA polymerase III subunit gamma/tau [Patescibacteria group bacterium]|jgi:DNA polymerase-3 subunit gamma/tau